MEAQKKYKINQKF